MKKLTFGFRDPFKIVTLVQSGHAWQCLHSCCICMEVTIHPGPGGMKHITEIFAIAYELGCVAGVRACRRPNVILDGNVGTVQPCSGISALPSSRPSCRGTIFRNGSSRCLKPPDQKNMQTCRDRKAVSL